MSLQYLEKNIKACEFRDCALHPTHGFARQVVPGIGHPYAKIMFIGEAPGENEDKEGIPFVPTAAAGGILSALFEEIGLLRSEVYITNTVKCRPPNNRDPLLEEFNMCQGYLNSQMALIKPEVVVLVGRIAKGFILPSTPPITKCHGIVYEKWITLDDSEDMTKVSYFTIYHPSYIKRHGGIGCKEYKETISDLQTLIDLCYGNNGWIK